MGWMGDSKLEFSCWDFAGQTVYYNTHQLFLSSRAVFIVCFNLVLLLEGAKGRAVKRLLYWLETIRVCFSLLSFLLSLPSQLPQARTNGCAVILVGTHLDKINRNGEDLNTICSIVKSVASKFNNIQKCVFISNTNHEVCKEKK